MSRECKTVLGLDLGTASIGWALASTNEAIEEGDVIAMRVRSFEEPVEPKGRTPKNAARREARGARRVTARRALRKQTLRSILQDQEMMPVEGDSTWNEWVNWDCYALRMKAATEKLTIREFGRVLYHMGQRRGFLSNRKTKFAERTNIPEIDELIRLDEEAEILRAKERQARAEEKGKDAQADKSDEGPVLAEIAGLQREIETSNQPTLGAYLHQERTKGKKVRGRHTLRAMFQEEFEKVWALQAGYYPQKLNDALKAQVYKALFFQRPLRFDPDQKADCRLEPGKKVAYKAHHLSEEIRIWQELANIRLKETSGYTDRPLTLEEKRIVADVLNEAIKPVTSKGELSWDNFRKLLKLPKKNLGQILINYEQGKAHPKLNGNMTNLRLNQATDNRWSTWSEDLREQVIETLLDSSCNDAAKLKRLVQGLDVSPKDAYNMVITSLISGTTSRSLRAIKKILPHLREGLDLYNASIAAGYTAEHLREIESKQKLHYLDLPDARNPGVNKCLHETRKVVNAIIRKYGMPDKIVVELARDLALNKIAKQGIAAQQRENKKLNDQAREAFAKFNNGNPNRDDIRKYGLWDECNGTCPYTGQAIPLERLWTKDWEIEHIVPRSLTLDDSFNNLTLAPSEVNQKKGNRLPSEYFASDPDGWVKAQARVKEFKGAYHKKKIFSWTREDLPDDLTTRQLNDTRYVSRLVRDYVKNLGVEVASASGKHTAYLRRHWGLHNILDESGEKNRGDHRHHAIDALVVALTTPTYIKRVCERSKIGDDKLTDQDLYRQRLTLPWPTIRKDTMEAVNEIIVSHEPQHKIRGPLHEDTGYGVHRSSDRLTTRKALADLTIGEIGRILDDGLRAKAIEALINAGLPWGIFVEDDDEDLPKSGKQKVKWDKEQEKRAKEILSNFAVIDAKGVQHPVVRVKLIGKKQDRSLYLQTRRALYPAGGNHWLLILEKVGSDERSAIIVPLWKAARMKYEKLGPESLVPEGWRLLFVLHKQDMLYLTDGSGPYRVKKFSPTATSVYLEMTPHMQADDVGLVRFVSNPKLKNLMPPVIVGMLGPET